MKAPGSWVVVAALSALSLSCGSGPAPDPTEETSADDKGGRLERLQAALARSPEWVDWNEPERSSGGYTLALFRRRIPFLMDMDGRVVHTWPDVRVSGRARLMRSGHLAVITSAGRFEEYDWQGRQTWTYRPRGPDTPHHDFVPLRNGNYLLLFLRRGERADYLVEVDRTGREVWRWNSYDALPEVAALGSRGDRTHMNSVQELPSNRWYHEGHEAFRPGNILVSARNLNTLYIVERPGGEVVWRYDEGLDWQHEARMSPPGVPGAGNIVLFNNRYHDEERRSSIVEIDPLRRSVTWSYGSPGFFSGTGGAQQVLPNGNLLVTSSRGGRAFELTRDGHIVWQWAPPFLPMRVSRYPPDFCPPLASLGPPSRTSIRRRDPEAFIDADLYAFALTHAVRHVRTDEGTVALLRRRNDCQRLRLPGEPRLRVGYGIHSGPECDASRGRKVRFGVSVRPDGGGASEDLLARAVGVEDFESEDPGSSVSLRWETVPLERFGGQRVEVCLTLASFAGGPAPGCFVWAPPGIQAGAPRTASEMELDEGPDVEEHQRRQLEALGYAN
jgi:hypothetical protein